MFEKQKVDKFFSILSKMGRIVEKRYTGYDKESSTQNFCEKEIFVRRTVNKWFKSKFFIWYRKSDQFGILYKSYVSVTNISYNLGWGEQLIINLHDYTRPYDIVNQHLFSQFDLNAIEGEFSDGAPHLLLGKMTRMDDVPVKEYVYKAYDMSKVKENSETIDKDSIKVNLSFMAKTKSEASELLHKFRVKNDNFLVIPEIIEIK
jgi:hypothetical protein